MKAILDTNLLVAGDLAHPGYDVAVACLSWAELEHGVRAARTQLERARRETRIARLRALLGRGLPFDDAAADAYGTLCGLVLGNGREVRGRAIDLMNPATAAAHDAAVLTRDAADFAGADDFVPVTSV